MPAGIAEGFKYLVVLPYEAICSTSTYASSSTLPGLILIRSLIASTLRRSLGANSINIVDEYITIAPNDQNVIDIFKGEWSSQFPGARKELKAGTVKLFWDRSGIEHPWSGLFLGSALPNHRIDLDIRTKFADRIMAEYHVNIGGAWSFGVRVQWTSWFGYWAIKGTPLFRTCDAPSAIIRLQLDFLSSVEEVSNGSGDRELLDYLFCRILEQLAPV